MIPRGGSIEIDVTIPPDKNGEAGTTRVFDIVQLRGKDGPVVGGATIITVQVSAGLTPRRIRWQSSVLEFAVWPRSSTPFNGS